MTWTPDDTWIVIVGVLTALVCSLPGSLLVVQRKSMLADAISHAVLPGLVIAWLIRGFHDPLFATALAGATGVTSVLLIEWLARRVRLESGAAIGVVFTSLFALGLLLVRTAADRAHLDVDHVLFGSLELTPLRTVDGWSLPGLGGVPRAAVSLAAVLVAEAIVIAALWPRLVATAFDPVHGELRGLHPHRLRLLLLAMTAIAAVAAFEAVGSILVLAMFATPAATASLWTRNMSRLLLLACLFGVLSVCVGHLAAIAVPRTLSAMIPALAAAGVEDTSSSGGMAAAAGLAFALGVVLRNFVQTPRRTSAAVARPPA